MPKRKGAQVTIPEPYEDIGSLYRVALATKELVEVLAGQRGDPGDRAVTYGEWRPPDQPKLPPAAQDTGEYVMCNGVWRKVRESFDLTGKGSQDFSVPTWGPSQAKINVYAWCNTTSIYTGLRVSLDGTTFMAGATDYRNNGFYRVGATNSFNTMADGQTSAWTMTISGDNATVPYNTEATVIINRSAQGAAFFRARGACWTAAGNMNENYYEGYMTPAGSTPFKAFRWLLMSGGPTVLSGRLTVDWLQ